jgi:hypothetical protein
MFVRHWHIASVFECLLSGRYLEERHGVKWDCVRAHVLCELTMTRGAVLQRRTWGHYPHQLLRRGQDNTSKPDAFVTDT